MARLTPLALEDMTPEQRKVADEIVSGPRGGMRGPFEAWLRSPGLADVAQKLGAYCRFESSLPPDLSELAILLTGKHWKAQFEFWAHARLAKSVGLAPEIIEAVRLGTPPPFTRDEERVIYDFVTTHFRENRVSDELFQRAVAAFGERGVVDLIGLVGYYGLVSFTLNVFEVPVPEGQTEPLS
ncbi:4-carboxymuconolactone decarboxylase [bacterium SCGC AG-212-C10]|nr:4-carboxymuconolactone decarboxylase [bacterium SCGC AG-212-C10]